MHRRLALFDIDGTLVADGGAAREAFAAGLREVFGYTGDLRRYDFSGRTDPQIAHTVLRDAGFTAEEIDGRMPALWERYVAGLAAAAPGRVRELPGIRALLDALEATAEVTIGLLTGNIEQGARIKLDSPDLNRYFPFGAFGSDSPHREKLPPIAVERRARELGIRDLLQGEIGRASCRERVLRLV